MRTFGKADNVLGAKLVSIGFDQADFTVIGIGMLDMVMSVVDLHVNTTLLRRLKQFERWVVGTDALANSRHHRNERALTGRYKRFECLDVLAIEIMPDATRRDAGKRRALMLHADEKRGRTGSRHFLQ